jgi:serpin B
LQVNELGTQAAAATSVGIRATCIFNTKDINFNRPFVYAVIDTKTNLPLFLGAMESPQSALAAQS